MIGAGRGGACRSARKKRQNGERRLPRLRRRKRFSPFSVAGDGVLFVRKSLLSCFLFSALHCFLCGRPGGLSCAAQSRLCRLCPAPGRGLPSLTRWSAATVPVAPPQPQQRFNRRCFADRNGIRRWRYPFRRVCILSSSGAPPPVCSARRAYS